MNNETAFYITLLAVLLTLFLAVCKFFIPEISWLVVLSPIWIPVAILSTAMILLIMFCVIQVLLGKDKDGN